jgi:hypothetical protein
MPKLTDEALRRAFALGAPAAPPWLGFWATVSTPWPLTVVTDEVGATPVAALGFAAYAAAERVYCLLVNEDTSSAKQRIVVLGARYVGP